MVVTRSLRRFSRMRLKFISVYMIDNSFGFLRRSFLEIKNKREVAHFVTLGIYSCAIEQLYWQ